MGHVKFGEKVAVVKQKVYEDLKPIFDKVSEKAEITEIYFFNALERYLRDLVETTSKPTTYYCYGPTEKYRRLYIDNKTISVHSTSARTMYYDRRFIYFTDDKVTLHLYREDIEWLYKRLTKDVV